MIDIKDVTFIIPVRIESNDRYRNLILSAGYLLKNTNANIIIMESDTRQLVPNILDKLFVEFKDKHNENIMNRVTYLFEQTNEKMFHRTRLLNEMIMESKTPIVVNYDCDVVLPLVSYQKATEMCRNDYDLVYPFIFGDNAQLRVVLGSPQEIIDFRSTSDLKQLKGFPWRAEYGFCQFFKKQSYIDGFMENENFLAYGPEDSERANRWQKLGYKIGRVNDLVYHFEHARTQNSAPSNPHMRTNEDLFDQLKKMDAEELKNYYSNQEYYKNHLAKGNK